MGLSEYGAKEVAREGTKIIAEAIRDAAKEERKGQEVAPPAQEQFFLAATSFVQTGEKFLKGLATHKGITLP